MSTRDAVVVALVLGLPAIIALSVREIALANESAPPTAKAFCPDQEDAVPVQRMDTGEPFCISPYTLAAYDDSVRAANAGTPKQGD